MKLEFSPKARRDLLEIGDYIALDNPRRAISFGRELRQRCENLTANPESGRLRPEIGEGYRVVPHGNYLVIYKNIGSTLRIERILHGARNIEVLFDDE